MNMRVFDLHRRVAPRTRRAVAPCLGHCRSAVSRRCRVLHVPHRRALHPDRPVVSRQPLLSGIPDLRGTPVILYTYGRHLGDGSFSDAGVPGPASDIVLLDATRLPTVDVGPCARVTGTPGRACRCSMDRRHEYYCREHVATIRPGWSAGPFGSTPIPRALC